MKNKTINYEGVNISIEESKKAPIINIETKDADIYINGVLVWQKYDKEEYALIPPALRDFIHRNNPYLEKNEDDSLTLAEFDVENQSTTFLIPFNSKKFIRVRVDLIDSMEILESDYIRNVSTISDETANKIVSDLKAVWNELGTILKKFKFKLQYSHSMGEAYYGWWDIVFTLGNWNEQNFIEVMQVVDKFNKTLRKYEEEYEFY